jgi:tetratricopeptide (TPR) repeat protein
MGLFGKDWVRELDRAEDFLRREIPVRALEIAERAEAKADPVQRTRAADVKARAAQAVLASVVAQAAAAEAAGNLADAADWLLAALEHESTPQRRAELEARRKALLERRFDDENPWPAQPGGRRGPQGGRHETTTVEAEAEEPDEEGSFQYEVLVSLVADELQPRYRNRPESFQQALVDLNEGRAEEALAAFESLVADAPKDPVLRLERGRARLLAGHAKAARDDFDAAWKAFGDGPLDVTGSQLAPALWAEATLAAGDPGAVAERLEALAAPATGQVEICRHYATALLASGRHQDARRYLEETASLVGDEDLHLLLARARVATGDPQRAIAALEGAIAPSCTAAGCAKGRPHLPSFRLLAELHLRHGDDRERVRELMAWVVNAQRGALGADDLAILSEYYTAEGNSEAARDARVEAERLRQAGDDAVARIEVDLTPRRGRVM